LHTNLGIGGDFIGRRAGNKQQANRDNEHPRNWKINSLTTCSLHD
jgi:hypothetical protein